MLAYSPIDPLRRRQLVPPPPPNAQQPTAAGPPAQAAPPPAKDINAYDLETAGTPPSAVKLAPALPASETANAPPQPTGLNSVGRLLNTMRQQQVSSPISTPADQPIVRMADEQPGPIRTAYPEGPPPPMRLAQLPSDILRQHAQENAPLNTPVTVDQFGLPVVGATKPLSRKHAILMGLVQGLVEGGKTGTIAGALAGGATGAIASGINPKLLYQLERHQELARSQADIDREMSNQARIAQIGDIQAQTQERAQQPELRRLQLQEQERIRQEAQTGLNARAAARIASNEKIAFERNQREQTRQAEMARRPQYRTDPTTGDIIEITPGTDGGQATSRVLRKGSKEAQSAGVAQSLYDTAGKLYDDPKNGYEALKKQAQDLRDQADKLDEDSPFISASQVKVLNKRADKVDQDADDLKKKVQGLQSEGDKRRAESRVGQQSDGQPQKGFDLGAWKADNPNATQAQIDAKRRQYRGRQIKE